jgi:hypothetical protein
MFEHTPDPMKPHRYEVTDGRERVPARAMFRTVAMPAMGARV